MIYNASSVHMEEVKTIPLRRRRIYKISDFLMTLKHKSFCLYAGLVFTSENMLYSRDCCAAQTLCNINIHAYVKHFFLLLMSAFLQNVK